MKKVKLTLGKYAMVDDGDFALVSQYKWCAHRNSTGYDLYYAWTRRDNKIILMHRLIMQSSPVHLDIDHINHDGLDNRKLNLRAVSRSDNLLNSRKVKFRLGVPTTSRHKGVCFDKSRKKWMSYKGSATGRIYFGRFNTEEEAANALPE